ncbi:hypothetical protein GPJ56_008721 [Histomonas meleagridis]|uniref:uncharacterized protein n=1 Tax=Histomonas meleagridis TaxID=135588 RepID=UPI00355AAF05|nr:hypothetical protein GPJ56_008721 [Histomonas meleagridis]KAH0803299.1 hypothetical protein GO595_004035 [Histomonas meleagridis]
MTRLITSTDISECISEIRQVAQLISSHVPQNSTRSVTRLLNSIDNPQSPKPNFYLSNSSQFSTFSAGSSSRTVSVELLENFLDLIDDSVENPLEILKEINDQMYRLKMFPNKHDVTSLFNFALRTYQTIRTQSCYNIVFNLMTQINNYCEPEKVLNLYLKSVSRSSRLNEFIEQCYQHFLLKNKQKLPKELNYPTSLTAKIQNIQRNDIELAFNCLSCWSSAYDGIIRIWNLLLQESDLDISDHFDALNYAQRCFLIHGLKELTEENKDIKKEKIEEKIKELEKMLPNEPKSSVVSRDAEQCANKMSEVMLSSSPAKDTLGATELKLQAMTPEPKHKMAETTYMFLTPRK